MSYQDLIYSVADQIATITLNRPDRMNALSRNLEAELHRAFDEADADPQVKVVILTGAGAAFCAGFDQQGKPGEQRGGDPTGKSLADFIKYWRRRDGERIGQWQHMWRIGTPIIAVVNGWAMGGGFWYQLAADITIASDKAVFAQPEVRHISNTSFLMTALCGWKHANRWGMTGDHFDAAEALRIGMVNEVVPHRPIDAAYLCAGEAARVGAGAGAAAEQGDRHGRPAAARGAVARRHARRAGAFLAQRVPAKNSTTSSARKAPRPISNGVTVRSSPSRWGRARRKVAARSARRSRSSRSYFLSLSAHSPFSRRVTRSCSRKPSSASAISRPSSLPTASMICAKNIGPSASASRAVLQRLPVEAFGATAPRSDLVGIVERRGQVEAGLRQRARLLVGHHVHVPRNPVATTMSRSARKRVAIAHSTSSSENTSTSSSTTNTCLTSGIANSAAIASRAWPGPPRLSDTRQCWRPLLASTKLMAIGSIRAARSARHVHLGIERAEVCANRCATSVAAVQHGLEHRVVAHGDGGDVEHRIDMHRAVVAQNSP